jgi:sterol desaturase/sphingolipid hydroxylase (fatty acid hydroxylase superfamily)
MDNLPFSESLLRLGIFLFILGLMLLWERRAPFRSFPETKPRRLGRHLGLMALNTVLVRIMSGGGAYFAAKYAGERDWGLFNQMEMPAGWSLAAGLVLLDFAIYLQHLVFHRIPLLWRLHKVHHLDLGFDTTTAIRFHPVEIVLSMYYKMALVLALGLSPPTVLAFEILLNACALFNHGNVRIPGVWEPRVRLFLITPDMHRIHHSAFPRETHSNFGFCVPFWDRLCGTYRAAPEAGQAGMTIGLDEERDPRRLGFRQLLVLPFR